MTYSGITMTTCLCINKITLLKSYKTNTKQSG